VTSAKSVSAIFTLNAYAITATASPLAGGTVFCSPASAPHGGSSTCTATANAGYSFTSFSGDCTGATCTLTNVTSARSVTANFSVNAYGIAATSSPVAGGTVTCSPNPVSHGASATCTATANPGYSFGVFNGDCVGPTCTLSNVTSARSVTAHFDKLPAVRGDANADARADLFWREAAPAQGLSWWTMNGAAATGANYYEVSPEWQIADVGDLDGDAMADLIWQRASDGAAYLWTLDGLGIKGFADLGVLDPAAWSLVGSADLDGDGKSDLVWRGTDGTVYGWLMNGGAIASQGAIGNPGTAWVIADLADMNGDGKSDIVFRNVGDGAVYVYFMNGLVVGSGGLAGVADPAAWTLVGVADFSGDGKGDFLWRHTSGDTWVWLMDGASFLSAGNIGNPGAGWSVRSLGDFDGDGKADLVWRNASGTTYFWKMDGAALSSSVLMTNPGGSWQIVSP